MAGPRRTAAPAAERGRPAGLQQTEGFEQIEGFKAQLRDDLKSLPYARMARLAASLAAYDKQRCLKETPQSMEAIKAARQAIGTARRAIEDVLQEIATLEEERDQEVTDLAGKSGKIKVPFGTVIDNLQEQLATLITSQTGSDRAALQTIKKSAESLRLTAHRGEAPTILMGEISKIEEKLKEVLQSRAVFNHDVSKGYGVDFVGDFAQLRKSLTKLRCMINLAELQHGPKGFVDFQSSVSQLAQLLAKERTSEIAERLAKFKLNGGGSDVEHENLERKVKELQLNIKLMEACDRLAEREREHSDSAADYISIYAPSNSTPQVDPNRLASLAKLFPETPETNLLLILVDHPNIDFKKLYDFSKALELRNIGKTLPKIPLGELADILIAHDLSRAYLKDLKELMTLLTSKEARTIANTLLKDPKLNPSMALALKKAFPDINLDSIVKFRQAFPRITPQDISRVLSNHPQLDIDKVIILKKAFPNENFQGIAKLFHLDPQLDVNKVAGCSRAFPRERPQKIVVALSYHPQLDVKKAAELAQALPHFSFKGTTLPNYLYVVAEMLYSDPQLEVDKAAKLLKAFRGESYELILRVLFENPELDVGKAAALGQALRSVKYGSVVAAKLSLVAEMLYCAPELDVAKATVFKEAFISDGDHVFVERQVDDIVCDVDKVAELKKLLTFEHPRVIAKVLDERPEFDLDKAIMLKKAFPNENIRTIARILSEHPQLDVDKVVKLKKTFPYENFQTVARVLSEHPQLDVDKARNLKSGLCLFESIHTTVKILSDNPQFDVLKANQLGRRLLSCDVRLIAKLLSEYPQVAVGKVAKLKIALKDENLQAIGEALSDYPQLNVEKAIEFKEAFPDESLQAIAEVLNDYPQLNVEKAIEFKEAFPDESLQAIAEVLNDYPQLNVEKAIEFKEAFPDESLQAIAEVLNELSVKALFRC